MTNPLNPFRLEPVDLGWGGGTFLPNIDVRETDHEVHIQADLPGVRPKDVLLEALGGVLTLRAQRRSEREDAARGSADGRNWETFERSVPLPADADASQATATFEKGGLTVTVPKSAEGPGGRTRIAIVGRG